MFITWFSVSCFVLTHFCDLDCKWTWVIILDSLYSNTSFFFALLRIRPLKWDERITQTKSNMSLNITQGISQPLLGWCTKLGLIISNRFLRKCTWRINAIILHCYFNSTKVSYDKCIAHTPSEDRIHFALVMDQQRQPC